MDNFTDEVDEILEGEGIPTTFPKLEGSENSNFPGLIGTTSLLCSAIQSTGGAGIHQNTPPAIPPDAPRSIGV